MAAWQHRGGIAAAAARQRQRGGGGIGSAVVAAAAAAAAATAATLGQCNSSMENKDSTGAGGRGALSKVEWP